MVSPDSDYLYGGGGGGGGALIGLFTHGLAIKKLLGCLPVSTQRNHSTGDKVIITVNIEGLKSLLNSARYKLVCTGRS